MKAGGRASKQLGDGRGGPATWVHDQMGMSGQQVRSSQGWEWVQGGPGSKAADAPGALAANSKGQTHCLGGFGSFSSSRRKEAVTGK